MVGGKGLAERAGIIGVHVIVPHPLDAGIAFVVDLLGLFSCLGNFCRVGDQGD